MRSCFPRRFVVLAIFVASLVVGPEPAFAENVLTRAGSAVGGFFRRMGDFLFREDPGDRDFGLALETYEKGEPFTTYRIASRLARHPGEHYRDDASLLRGLAAASVDLREPAVAALERVLATEPPSAYYPVALVTLLELEERFGNHRAAATVASKRLTSFWRKPKTKREAAIKAVFLEQGKLSPFPEPRSVRVEQLDIVGPDRRDRPADRAVYLAGIALLREKKFEEAMVAFDTLAPKSVYFPYGRYGLAQASYGLGNFPDVETLLIQVQGFPAITAGERFLRDRAALLLAQLADEMDDDDAALAWLDHVSDDGPYAWHAALMAGEIRARGGNPAMALVYFKEQPEVPAEPKLRARAASLDAELHRDLGDTKTAVAKLQKGIATLDTYLASLEAGGESGSRVEKLRGTLRDQEKRRDRLDVWRRENLVSAMPDLYDWQAEPGWLSEAIAGWASRGNQEVAVVYHPNRYDPFSALPLPQNIEIDPPNDGAFPPVFRKSLGRALSDVFRRELALAAADRKDAQELALLLLDGELRLAAMKDGRARPSSELLDMLGLGSEVDLILSRNLAPPEVMHAVLESRSVQKPDADRRAALRELARSQLERWRGVERELLRQALTDERSVVEDLRYGLDVELSRVLALKSDDERRALGDTH
jgi:tetratricopeptide (TPR) repeat protein